MQESLEFGRNRGATRDGRERRAKIAAHNTTARADREHQPAGTGLVVEFMRD